MRLILLLSWLSHVWLLRHQPKRFWIEGSITLLLFLGVIFLQQPYGYAIILLCVLASDTKHGILLCPFMVLLFLLSYSISTYLVIWVLVSQLLFWYGIYGTYSYEMQLQEYQNKVFDRQVKEVEHMFVTMRGWRHDYHNHLQNLKAKLKQQDLNGSIVYLDELEQELREIRQLVETGNVNMDAILNAKLSLALQQGIEINVKAKVPPHISISDTDMSALLGNLVDNAVEACAQVSTQAFIRLYINQYKGQLYISCSNATHEVVRKLDEEYITSKRGNHGHGLKRMNQIVDKYQGSITRNNEPGVFNTEILLPL